MMNMLSQRATYNAKKYFPGNKWVERGFYTKTEFAAALTTAADNYSVELPDEWWDCLVERYTPQQLRFAEICREVIVPALRMLGDKEADDA